MPEKLGAILRERVDPLLLCVDLEFAYRRPTYRLPRA